MNQRPYKVKGILLHKLRN